MKVTPPEIGQLPLVLNVRFLQAGYEVSILTTSSSIEVVYQMPKLELVIESTNIVRYYLYLGN